MYKTKPTFESFYLSDDIPLDKKSIISSISNVNSELPINHRYLGLIFFSSLERKFYSFKNDINNPELLFNEVNVSNTFGIYVNNYSQILTELNNFNALGKIIFVFPLNVAFMYNGTNWEYYSGVYNLRTGIDYNNINNQIKKIGAKVNYENNIKIWNENYLLSDLILKTNLPENKVIFDNNNQLIEDRLYIHRLELYKVLNGKKIKIGNYLKEIVNFTINIGETKIDEILFTDSSDINLPPYLNPIIWIDGYATVKSANVDTIPIKLQYKIKKLEDRFEIYIISDKSYTGTLEIR